tara:strand:+ start:65337 stop:65444 length:108 start_codon:yes stop_codon:yes gene_type:complete
MFTKQNLLGLLTLMSEKIKQAEQQSGYVIFFVLKG